MMNRSNRWILCLIVLVLFLAACGRGYSDGSRVGTVTKISRKGLFFKSYEGEMNLGGTRRSGDSIVANVSCGARRARSSTRRAASLLRRIRGQEA